MNNIKKTIIATLITLINAFICYAQTSVAILSHESTVTSYSGADAFKKAIDAAVDGDVITLSSGSFLAAHILKDVTIRGAGMDINSQSGAATVLLGDFSVNGNQYMEGIYHDGVMHYSTNYKSGTFVKCRFKDILPYSNSYSLRKTLFVHCKVANSIKLLNYSDVTCMNSVLSGVDVLETGCSLQAVNSILTLKYTTGMTNNGASTIFKLEQYNLGCRNCILYCEPTGYAILVPYFIHTNTCNFNYNILCGISLDGLNDTNKNSSLTTIFRTWDGNWSDSETFETNTFSDEDKDNYLGDDGKIIGIYGGRMPFNPHPTYPRLSKFEVDSATDSDGKLKVNIQVANE